MARILIADDDPGFRAALAETLESLGHEVVAVATGADALDRLGAGVDAMFLDFSLPDMTGTEVLHAIRRRAPGSAVPIVMLTAYASADNTIEAMKLGAFDHLAKPVSRAVLERVLAEALSARGAAPGPQRAAKEEEIIAASNRMRETVKLIGRAAASDTTVLITGETGTGKERVARALHQHGTRAARPFVAVNCAAIPRDLLESELFGYARGAFTGATATRVGIIQQADGGTLLLDEIGDLSVELQAKLLRVLEERAIVPIGADRPVSVNVRLVAATHRDLDAEVQSGRFRQDLFYRLNVLRIEIAPLRERPEDIAPLAEHFLALAGDPPKILSAAARTRLETHPWPGNVRELRNVLERAVILARGHVIEAGDLGFTARGGEAVRTPAGRLPEALARLEEAMIRGALAEAGGNRTAAARRLGIHRQLLYAKLRQYGIDD